MKSAFHLGGGKTLMANQHLSEGENDFNTISPFERSRPAKGCSSPALILFGIGKPFASGRCPRALALFSRHFQKQYNTRKNEKVIQKIHSWS